MSSRKYETELSTDSELRAVVAVSLAAAYSIGIWVIVSLPVAGLQQLLAAFGWSLINALQCWHMTKAYKRWRSIRIGSDGAAALLDSKGIWHSAAVGRNCIVLSNFAWMNLIAADGDSCYELVRGNSIESEQWRHLQVIWRHMGRDS